MKKSRFQHPVMRRINHLWQAALAYFFVGVFWILPLPVASHVGGWIGRTLGPRLGISRRAWKHLTYIYPEKTDIEKKQIIVDMWDNLGRTIAESPHIAELGKLDRVTIEGLEHVEAAKSSGRSAMMLSGHFGNWEIALMVVSVLGMPVSGVYRKPNNPYVDALIRFLRRDVAVELFPKGPDSVRSMMRLLREGKNVGLLLDQKLNEGIELDFAGKPAMTGISPVQMAIMTNAHLMTGYVIREKNCHFRVVFLPPLEIPATGSVEEKAIALTAMVNKILTEHLHRYPGQWLWLHRRWIGI